MNESDPTRLPLLFPDPVVEFYIDRLDRTAIREHLKKTPAERLQWLEDQTAARWQTGQARVRAEASETAMNEASTAKKFADFLTYTPDPDPASRPLLFPDPVVEVYLKDIDRGLIREQLKLTATQRLRCLESMAEFYEAARRARVGESRQTQDGRPGR